MVGCDGTNSELEQSLLSGQKHLNDIAENIAIEVRSRAALRTWASESAHCLERTTLITHAMIPWEDDKSIAETADSACGQWCAGQHSEGIRALNTQLGEDSDRQIEECISVGVDAAAPKLRHMAIAIVRHRTCTAAAAEVLRRLGDIVTLRDRQGQRWAVSLDDLQKLQSWNEPRWEELRRAPAWLAQETLEKGVCAGSKHEKAKGWALELGEMRRAELRIGAPPEQRVREEIINIGAWPTASAKAPPTAVAMAATRYGIATESKEDWAAALAVEHDIAINGTPTSAREVAQRLSETRVGLMESIAKGLKQRALERLEAYGRGVASEMLAHMERAWLEEPTLQAQPKTPTFTVDTNGEPIWQISLARAADTIATMPVWPSVEEAGRRIRSEVQRHQAFQIAAEQPELPWITGWVDVEERSEASRERGRAAQRAFETGIQR